MGQGYDSGMATNAKHEFVRAISGKAPVLCAKIERANGYANNTAYLLPIGWTEEHYALFLSALDFTYDNGFGCQELFGTIWYTDGTWSDRGEYDGSEWWIHRSTPQIPSDVGGE